MAFMAYRARERGGAKFTAEEMSKFFLSSHHLTMSRLNTQMESGDGTDQPQTRPCGTNRLVHPNYRYFPLRPLSTEDCLGV